MNKRELIKALFNDPTIKALYESGEFNASDINRAILAEAVDDEKVNAELKASLERSLADLTKSRDALAAKIAKLKTGGQKPDKKATKALRGLEKEIETIENALAQAVAKTGKVAKAAAATPSPKDDKFAAKASTNLAAKLAKLQVPEPNSPTLKPDVANLSKDTKAVVTQADGELDQVSDFVKKAQQAKGQEKQVPDTKGWDRAKVSIRGAIQRNKLTLDKIKQSLETVESFRQLFKIDTLKVNDVAAFQQADELFKNGWIAQELERLKKIAEEANSAEDMIEPLGNAGDTVMGWYDFVSELSMQKPQFQIPEDFKFPEGPAPASEKEFKQQFIAPLEVEAPTRGTSPQDYTIIADQVIAAAPNLLDEEDLKVEGMKEFIGWYVAGRSTGTLQESDGPSGAFQNIDTKYAQRITQYSGTGKAAVTRHINNNQDRWNDIFKGLEDLIESGKISIAGPPAPAPTEEPQTDKANLVAVQQQQEEALEQQADVNQDKELSSMEQEELDASWKTTLDEFFGKSAESSSFMNQLLLRKQSDLLYGMIKTLTQIIVGDRKPKTGGGTEAGALTDVGDEEEDNNQPATQAAPGKRDDVLEEQIINEIFDSLFGGKKGGNETVQLSRKSTKNMRQHLEAMVTLLRSLKSDINDYSQFSTRESADPRFDGSSLKKAMDAKLAVTQKRIAMLTKQIEISVADQDSDVENMNEDKKSERRLKVQKVREVYNEMRRLYIDSLMVDLENGKVKKAKRSAQEMKNYILNEKEFLSYFPKGMIVGTSVMTLSEAHESMSLIIKKFIDTIRDVVTITKSQEVSKEQLAVAADNLLEIANQIEALFKVPSQIDKAFMEKYVKLAASDPSSGSLSDEKPSSEDSDFILIKKWFSNNASAVADKISEKLLKALANGFKGKSVSDQEREETLRDVAPTIEWYSQQDSLTQMAISNFMDNLLDIQIQKNLQENIELPGDFEKMMADVAMLSPGLDSESLKDEMLEAIKSMGDPQEIDAILKLMRSDAQGLANHISISFAVTKQLGRETAIQLSPSNFEIESDEEAGDDDPGPTSPEGSEASDGEGVETGDPSPMEKSQTDVQTQIQNAMDQQKFIRFSEKNKLIGGLAQIISEQEWSNDAEKLEALMAAQSYMSTYVEEQVLKNPELSDDQKDEIKKYLKDNIIGDTKNEGLIKESEDDKSTPRPDGSDPTEEPHESDYGLSFLGLLSDEDQKILRSKEGLVKKLAEFIDENFKNLIKDYSNNKYLAKISVPVETKMKDLDLKNFDGKKEIQNFWTFVADLFGKLNLEEDIQYFEEASNKKYGKFSTNARALIKKLDDPYKTADVLKYDDVKNLEREMKSFLEFILKNKLSVDQSKLEQDSALKNRFVFIVDSFGKNLRYESNKVSLTKQLAPFMRFTRRLKKNTRHGKWYRSSFLSDITKEFERIIDEKNLVNYIEKSNHNPQPSSSDFFEESLEKALKPIIETMLKEHYNY